MPTVRTQVNTQQIEQAIIEAFRANVFGLSRQFSIEISRNQWAWIDGELRDIIDTGQLRASQQVEFSSDTSARFSWNREYAAAAHNGAVYRNGRTLPGRPWTRPALRNYDLEQNMREDLGLG